MKKINELTHFIFSCFFLLTFIISCGTEEIIEKSLKITASTTNVQVGSPIHFSASTLEDGDLTEVATFYVNDQAIEGNTFIPSVENPTNEVYATYNGMTSPALIFASTIVVPSEYTQKVLVEDYTGTWCIYCPRMAQILDYFTEYSDRVIPIAIHCDGVGIEDPWVYEHYQQMINVNNYNAPAQPRGKINRIFEVDMLQYTQPCPNDPVPYTQQLDSYLNQSAPLGLAINSSLNGNNLNINIKVGFAVDQISNPRLVVNLIEEELYHAQANAYAGSNLPNCIFNQGAYNSNPIPNFPQKHVLLKSYTDIFGDDIPLSVVQNGNIWTKEFNVSLPPNVTNPQNLHLVAFVLGNGDEVKTRAVINVQSAKINTNQPFD